MPFLVFQIFKQIARPERMKTKHGSARMYEDSLLNLLIFTKLFWTSHNSHW